MSETIQTRTTQEQSGNYRVYATATVGGEQPVKGLAVHTDVIGRVGSPDFAKFELSDEGPAPLVLEPDKATSATVRMASANGPAVRHVYVSPEFLSQFDSEFEFDGEDTDLDEVPSLAISGIEASDEDTYESDKESRSSAEEAADALFGDSDEESDDSDESEADASDDDSDDEGEVEISDEEIGIAE
jgi:hypothetical protein